MVKLILGLNGIAELTGKLIAWFLLGMVAITAVVVTLRYGFGRGSIALQESVIYLHAMVFMLGAAYTLKHDRHVRVDIFYRNFSPARKALVDLLGTWLLLMPVCGYVVWMSLEYVSASWAIFEGSREAGGLPLVFALKSLIPASMVLLVIQAISNSLACIQTMRDEASQ